MPERSRPSTVALVVEQVRYQNRLFRRNPMAASFTLAFPMIFLVLFGALFDEIDVAPGVWVEAAQFYAPGLAVFAAVSATYRLHHLHKYIFTNHFHIQHSLPFMQLHH